MKQKLLSLLLSLCLLTAILAGCVTVEVELPGLTEDSSQLQTPVETQAGDAPEIVFDLDSLPPYSGSPYTAVNGNVPFFLPEEITDESYEVYAPLDNLGRCTLTYASIGKDLMPTEKRGSISSVKPSGWINAEYDWVDGRFLYNRCHLIGFQLTGENANEENLITGTRYLNVEGMLPFENMVADYIKETGNHVMYRVTPVYTGSNLVADGVLMEALSVEDQGEGISFCVYCYNVQPGVVIDYRTGESRAEGTAPAEAQPQETGTYILNTNSKKFHTQDCPGGQKTSKKNKQIFTGSRDQLIAEGYTPCGSCKP